jgi:hypothetical protein
MRQPDDYKGISKRELREMLARAHNSTDRLRDAVANAEKARDAAQENLDKAVESGDVARNERSKYLRQLQSARSAFEDLRRALYPDMLKQLTPNIPFGGILGTSPAAQFPVSWNG